MQTIVLHGGKEMQPPNLLDVYKARKIVYKYLERTPLLKSFRLSRVLGCEVYVKCENLQPIGAFKIRGGLNLVSNLSEEEKRRGIITASTGNHGQSIAYASNLFGVKAIIGMPEDANPLKADAIRAFGAKVALHGKDFDEAKDWVESEAKRVGYRYVHSGNEPFLISGVGTLFLEIIEEVPDIETIIIPVGGGSTASAGCIVSKTINPDIEVIGVQSEGAPAVYKSWKSGEWVTTESIATFAEGLATRAPFELTMQIMREMLDDMVLVTEDEIKKAILTILEATHLLAEGAGAASTAAAFKIKDQLRNKKVALILSGGNLTLDQLTDILNHK
jgi:threonine dehydratase